MLRVDTLPVASTVESETPAALSGLETVMVPLYVDLDGTLIRGDMLWESVALLLRRSPWETLKLPFWVLRGKAALKAELALRVVPEAATLPYREDVVAFVRGERERGRRTILATASHEKLALAVNEHLQLFDDVLASDSRTNLSAGRKLDGIRAHLPGQEFDYIGDSRADVPVLKAARKAYVAGNSGAVRKGIGGAYETGRHFGQEKGGMKAWVRALRPMQWSKNVLVFVPLLTAHRMKEWRLDLAAVIAFVAISMVASSVYLLNDLVDLESDRQHPRKKKRPMAAGTLSLPKAMMSCAMLAAGGIALSVATLPWKFVATLGLYLLCTMVYSLWLKRKLLVDVIMLAGLYTLRIVAGGAAVDVEISQWLLAFSMFFFLSLAFVKRYSELLMMNDRAERFAHGRGYWTDDIAMVESVGPASGYMAVLVFGLYINQSDVAKTLYHHPVFLWLLCPILLYWITRVWFLARRRQLSDDPIAFALRDRISIFAGLLAVAAAVMASLPFHFQW